MSKESVMPVIYIAGRFRGANSWEVERNIRAAEECGMLVAELGAVPLIPHAMYRFWDGTLPDSFWLQCGLRLLDSCDALVAQGNIGDSLGTQGEIAHAEMLGIPYARIHTPGLQWSQLNLFVTSVIEGMRLRP